MEPNKVYTSIVKLLFNVVRSDELKYQIYKDENYRKQFLALINDLLTLELTEKTEFHDKQWATTFGKAIVVITGKKQRLEKNDKSLEEIYADYSNFLTFTNKEFKVDNLAETSLIFTQEEILLDAKLSPQKISQFEEKEATKAKQENAKDKNEKSREESSDDQVTQEPNFKGTTSNPYLNDIQNNMPTPPMSDPRFNPYSKKPKWMQWMRWILGGLVIALSVTMIVLMAFGATRTINFSKDVHNMPDEVNSIGSWVIDNPMWGKNNNQALMNFDKTFRVDFTDQWNTIISCLLYGFAGGYLGYVFLKKPNSVAEKYHVSYIYFLVLFITYLGTISMFYRYLDLNFLRGAWGSNLENWVGKDFKLEEFNEWWKWIVDTKELHQLQGLAIACTVFAGLLSIFSIIVMIIQPHLDRAKLAHANEEYQRAIASAMQGQEYQMDPALFDDENKIIHKKSRFALWRQKQIEKKHKKKDKSEE